jgi:hypothetical protein
MAPSATAKAAAGAGTDGYEDAVKQIGEIEQRLGLADLAQFTSPAPRRG